ncbi:MAG: dihydroorotase [Cytophagales bacterium]|nr:dihydroorotase [Cytophagales bacterium]
MNTRKRYLIKGAELINEGVRTFQDVLISDGRIQRIGLNFDVSTAEEIRAEGLLLLPGMIDDQVHFREPGLTHKADIFTESRAAVAGGITSFMEMPNVIPQTTTQELLAAKYALGAKKSLANYSFYMGVTNANLEEVLKTDTSNVCGLKIFMGSSTGDMLVDDEQILNQIFANSPMLVAVHCEDEETVRSNLAEHIEKYGEEIPIDRHPVIRSREACYKSSSLAVELARKHNTRLHILHISTAEEVELFDNQLGLSEKRITSEACVHHLWFSADDYKDKGPLIKWNPAVKSATDREALWRGLLENKIDVLATDHAPHTLEEKQNIYTKAPSGGPLVQHALMALLESHKQGKITLERLVEKMSHAPAVCFQVKERGFIREGYWADLVLVDLNGSHQVDSTNILSKCGWSPFEGQQFGASVHSTFISGHLAFHKGSFDDDILGERLVFNR